MGTILADAVLDRASTLLVDVTKRRWPDVALIRWLNDGQLAILALRPDAYTAIRAVQLIAGTRQFLPVGDFELLDVPRNIDQDVAGVAASGTLAAAVPINTDTVTIGPAVYTFRTALTSPAVTYEVLLGGSATAARLNLVAAINGASGEGTAYGTGSKAHPLVTAVINGTAIDVTARETGIAGNTIATTAVLDSGSWGAAVLQGGVDAAYSSLTAPRYLDRKQLDLSSPSWHQATAAAEIVHWMYDRAVPKTWWCYPPQPAVSPGFVELDVSAAPPAMTIVGVDGGLLTSTLGLDDIYLNPLLQFTVYRAYSEDSEYAQSGKAAASYNEFLQSLGLKTETNKRFVPKRNQPPRYQEAQKSDNQGAFGLP
jgi:hypothetical protein